MLVLDGDRLKVAVDGATCPARALIVGLVPAASLADDAATSHPLAQANR
jgi:hypothetical protein